MDSKAELSHDDFSVDSRERVYDGFFKLDKLRLRHACFRGGEQQAIQRELFVRGDAAAAIPYDPDNHLIALIDQFRVGALKQAAGPWCLEAVAGMIDSDETPEQVIARELQEEANITAKRLDYIGNYLSSPGGTDEKLHLFCAICDLRQAEGVFGLDSEGEDIRVRVFDVDTVLDGLYSGGLTGRHRYNNAATLICLQWLHFQRTQRS